MFGRILGSSPRGGSFARRRWLALLPIALVLVIAAYVVTNSRTVSDGLGLAQARIRMAPEAHTQTAWASCNRNAYSGGPSTFVPLSDEKAASLVTREPETRPYNSRAFTLLGVRYTAPNDYVPTTAQIRQFRSAKTSIGQPVLQFNPYFRYVDGRDGMKNPSTDDLIQWAAHKWGIPENWLRAEYLHESSWDQYFLGDETAVSAASYNRYPYQSRVPGTHKVHQSIGITQVRWAPDGSLGPGTEPLRWESTAFNVDEQAAMVRFYYDNPQGSRSVWGDASYKPCQEWSSIGGWFLPYPWDNPGQASYVHAVQQILANKTWTTTSFVNWAPSSFPRGIRFVK